LFGTYILDWGNLKLKYSKLFFS